MSTTLITRAPMTLAQVRRKLAPLGFTFQERADLGQTAIKEPTGNWVWVLELAGRIVGECYGQNDWTPLATALDMTDEYEDDYEEHLAAVERVFATDPAHFAEYLDNDDQPLH